MISVTLESNYTYIETDLVVSVASKKIKRYKKILHGH